MNTPQIDRNMFAQIRNFCLTAEQSAKEAGVLLALGKEDEAKAFIDRGTQAYTDLIDFMMQICVPERVLEENERVRNENAQLRALLAQSKDCLDSCFRLVSWLKTSSTDNLIKNISDVVKK